MTTDLGQPIAYGRTAEIYAWTGGKLLKLFYGWFDPESIDYEARIARAVHASGLPVPAVGEILRVGDRTGLIYQRIDGSPMTGLLFKKPWTALRHARRMAELHAQMHAGAAGPDFPTQRQRLIDKIGQAKALPDTLRAGVRAALDGLPGGDRLCHGDFHPGNILVTRQGETVIDWMDASRGNPLADVARTTLLVLGAAETGQVASAPAKAFVRAFHGAYLRRYFRLRPGGEDEYRRWLPVVAAARLSEEVPGWDAWLVGLAGRAR